MDAPAAAAANVALVQHRPPPTRSQTVLVVTPEYPPPLPHDQDFQFWLHTPYITKGSRFEVSKLGGIAQASCFVSAGGTTIGAYGREPDKSGRTTDGHRFVLSPSQPLAADQWYALLINGDEFLRIADELGPASSSNGSSNLVRLPFFTGSAPRIVAVRRDDASPTASLEVAFSEPLRITASLCQSLLGARRDPLDRACEAEQGQLAGGVRLQLSRAAAWGAFELRLPGAARGEHRSVAEGLELHRSPRARPVLRLAASDFSACGAQQCWREPPPLELERAARGCGP